MLRIVHVEGRILPVRLSQEHPHKVATVVFYAVHGCKGQSTDAGYAQDMLRFLRSPLMTCWLSAMSEAKLVRVEQLGVASLANCARSQRQAEKPARDDRADVISL